MPIAMIPLTATNRGRGIGKRSGPVLVPQAFALQFDGSQNYVDIGTLGNLGSSLGSGLYVSFVIKTTDTGNNKRVFSVLTASNRMAIQAYINAQSIAGQFLMFMLDNNAHTLSGTCLPNLQDGIAHTVSFTMLPATNTITCTVDGVAQSITPGLVQTPVTFINFTKNIVLGTLNNNGVINNTVALNGTLDNFKIGTSVNTLFASYAMDEGTGTTIADGTGNGNTGTLTGSPLPTWVAGIA